MRLRRRARCTALTLALLLGVHLATPAFAYIIPIKGYPKIELSGSNTLSLNVNQVHGSESYFREDNYGSERTFTQMSSVYLRGELLQDLHFDASVSADRFAPNPLRWNLWYEGHDATVRLGEFSANLGGNEFVLFNRTLKGVQVDAKLPQNGTLSLVASQLNAPVRTESFYGRNTSGPYYLSATPVVDGSAVVMLNNERLTLGKDYTLDLDNGILDFVGRIITPSDRVTVSYEAAINGALGGMLYVMRATYPLRRVPGLKLGVSRLQLQGRGTPGSTIENDMEEEVLPQPDFQLRYRPVKQYSEQVTVVEGDKSTVYVRDIDYTISYATGIVKFTHPLPINISRIIVKYKTAIPVDGIAGDRSVTGVDMNWQGFGGVSVNVQAAQSDAPPPMTEPKPVTKNFDVPPGTVVVDQTFTLDPQSLPVDTAKPVTVKVTYNYMNNEQLADTDYTLNPLTGELHILRAYGAITNISVAYTTRAQTIVAPGNTALLVNAGYAKGKLATTVGLRKVDPGFTPLEMVGYRTAQDILNWSARYVINDALNFATTGENARQPYDPYSPTGLNSIAMLDRTRTYSLNFRQQNWPSLSLTRMTRDAGQASGDGLGNSSCADSLSMAWARDAISANLNLSRTTTDSSQFQYSSDPYQPLPENPDPQTPLYHYRGTTNSAAFGIFYNPSERLSLGVNLSGNKIKSGTDGQETNSGASSAQANAHYQFIPNRLSFDASLGTTKTDPTQTLAGSEVPGVTSNNLRMSSDWRVSEDLSFNVDFTADRSQGGDYSDSDSRMLTVSSRWQPLEKLALNGYWTRQNLMFLGDAGSSQSNMIGVNSTIGPVGKADIRLDAQHIWGENAVGVGQLAQTAGRRLRAIPDRVDYGTPVTSTGNRMTSVTGEVSYPLGIRQSLSVNGDMVLNGGIAQSRRYSYGLGWHYRLMDGLNLSLNAGQVRFLNETGGVQNYTANRMNAQLSWSF